MVFTLGRGLVFRLGRTGRGNMVSPREGLGITPGGTGLHARRDWASRWAGTGLARLWRDWSSR